MREKQKITLIIAPSREAAAKTLDAWQVPRGRLCDGRALRVITDPEGLRGWHEGTPCLIDFTLFGRADVRLKDLAQSLLAHGRLRRIGFKELRELRGEMV
ncbi:hypothetical protein [Allorhizobium taibaishanense]|uniref:Uncharacterized protein n=1 Tax=Allorhizobium taibaishanense TaxID=887144 RepID=A0A1Q9A2Q7_9HYPH|nr:hypothetical protein [Allorhizobium taibaishanense]MBB4005822.1 hypothetical protein [Allorhizobium taibaishanense]OLP48870.1 hypothetical protein BJF91_17195 [Allorhizobium taibaishanense]